MRKQICSVRSACIPPPGYVWTSIDYSAQEIRVAAALAKDQELIRIFELRKNTPYLVDANGDRLVRPNGKFYKNPRTDLHLMAALPVFPELQDAPDTELEEMGTTPLPNGKVPRKIGKTLNLGLIYGMGAANAATRIGCTEKEAEKMIALYFAQYCGLYQFLTNSGKEAHSQGFVRTPIGLTVFVKESNAKGLSDEKTISRKGANAQIQSSSAYMCKRAVNALMPVFRELDEKWGNTKTPGLLGPIVHDELNLYIPGSWPLSSWAERGGASKPMFADMDYVPQTREEAMTKEYASKAAEVMVQVEEEMLTAAAGQYFPGEVEINIGQCWVH